MTDNNEADLITRLRQGDRAARVGLFGYGYSGQGDTFG